MHHNLQLREKNKRLSWPTEPDLFLTLIADFVLVSGNSTVPTPTDDDDDDWDEDESSEIDDEGNDGNKIYKNPRNSPSTLCPRDEEQATLLVYIFSFSYNFVLCLKGGVPRM